MSQPLPRFRQTPIETDPLERILAQRQAEHERARHAIANGHTLDADPADLRGIPCIARGVGGTSPGTNPLTTTIRRLSIRTIRYPADVGDGTRP